MDQKVIPHATPCISDPNRRQSDASMSQAPCLIRPELRSVSNQASRLRSHYLPRPAVSSTAAGPLDNSTDNGGRRVSLLQLVSTSRTGI